MRAETYLFHETGVRLFRMIVKDSIPPSLLVPHSQYGDPDWCGLIFPVVRDREGDFTCDECRQIVLTVPTAEESKTVLDLAVGGTVRAVRNKGRAGLHHIGKCGASTEMFLA